MKFYKRLMLNRQSTNSLELTYQPDGQVIMDIRNPAYPNPRPDGLGILRALKVPTGTGDPNETAGSPLNERPVVPYSSSGTQSGLVRYNTTLKALEVFSVDRWIQLRSKEPANIIHQTFGAKPYGSTDLSTTYVDGVQRLFGPLIGQQGQAPDSARAIFVYVENVFQIPEKNYTMIGSDSIETTYSNVQYVSGFYLLFKDEAPPLGKEVLVIHGFD